jgi:hypothetical protein
MKEREEKKQYIQQNFFRQFVGGHNHQLLEPVELLAGGNLFEDLPTFLTATESEAE